MRSGEVSYQREPDHKQVPAKLVSPMSCGVCDEVWWRKDPRVAYSATCSAICGNDFELGSVYLMVFGDRGQELGEMCPTCLEYLNRRKADAEDPTFGYWPARSAPFSVSAARKASAGWFTV